MKDNEDCTPSTPLHAETNIPDPFTLTPTSRTPDQISTSPKSYTSMEGFVGNQLEYYERFGYPTQIRDYVPIPSRGTAGTEVRITHQTYFCKVTLIHVCAVQLRGKSG